MSHPRRIHHDLNFHDHNLYTHKQVLFTTTFVIQKKFICRHVICAHFFTRGGQICNCTSRIYKALKQKSPQIPLPRTSTAPLLHSPPPTAAGLRRWTASRSASTTDRPRWPATGMSPRLIQSLVEFICHRIVSSLCDQHFALARRSASNGPRVG